MGVGPKHCLDERIENSPTSIDSEVHSLTLLTLLLDMDIILIGKGSFFWLDLNSLHDFGEGPIHGLILTMS